MAASVEIGVSHNVGLNTGKATFTDLWKLNLGYQSSCTRLIPFHESQPFMYVSYSFSILFGERCPKEVFPTLKAIRQSVLLLCAKLCKLQKGHASDPSKDEVTTVFLLSSSCVCQW